MLNKSNAKYSSPDMRSKDDTSRDIRLTLPSKISINSKDNSTQISKPKFTLPNDYLIGPWAKDVSKRNTNKVLAADPLEINSQEESPVRNDKHKNSALNVRMSEPKVNIIFVPTTLLLTSSNSQPNFHSFGKLVSTHRDELKKIDPDLQVVGDHTCRSELEKQLDFNKTQEKLIMKRMQDLKKEKITTFYNDRKEQARKERKMPKVRMYPSRELRANPPLNSGGSDDSSNGESEANSSKDQQARTEAKVQTTENMNSILSKQIKIFKYRNFETVEWRPEGREAATLVSNGRFAYLFGGISQNTIPYMEILDVIRWTWKKVEPRGEIPDGRLGHSAFYYQNKIIIFGGQKKYNSYLRLRECLSDVFAFSTNSETWSRLRCFGDFMEPRRNHIAAVIGDYMLVYGGVTTYGEYRSDLKVLSFATMKWMACIEEGNPEIGIAFHASVLAIHPLRKKLSLYRANRLINPDIPPHIKEEGLYIFGGKDETGAIINTLRILKVCQKPLKWIVPDTIGQPPAQRIQHTMDYYDGLNCIIIYGGRNDHTRFLGDISVLYLENLSWMGAIVCANPITPRFSHCSTVVGSKLCVFGGLNFQSYMDSDVEVLELDQASVLDRIKQKNDFLVKKDYLLPDIIQRVQFQESKDSDHIIRKRKEEIPGPINLMSYLPKPTKEELQRPSWTDLDGETTPHNAKLFIRKNHKKMFLNFSTSIRQALAHIPKSLLDSFTPKKSEKKTGFQTAR